MFKNMTETRILFLVLLGFVVAALFDIACPRHAESAVILNKLPDKWRIEFTAHPLNVAIQLDTECKGKDGKLGFIAVDVFHIQPEWADVTVHRQLTPKGERCTVVVHVFRNPEGGQGDPDQDYIGESSIIVTVD